MQECPNCSHRNRPGLLFCESCGTSLIGDSPLSTRNLAAKSPTGELDVATVLDALGNEVFGTGTILRIEVDGAEPILLKPKEETLFGRRDPSTGTMPDVDMTPFAGYRMGVSRKHAIIKQNANNDRLELWDLNSSNGTFLNGTRLSANKPYKIRDGDEIRFGQMAIKIYFENAGALSPTAPGDDASDANAAPPPQSPTDLDPNAVGMVTITNMAPLPPPLPPTPPKDANSAPPAPPTLPKDTSPAPPLPPALSKDTSPAPPIPPATPPVTPDDTNVVPPSKAKP